jgi:hypothetical protein
MGVPRKKTLSVESERVNLIPRSLYVYAISEFHDVTESCVDANLLTGTINHLLLFAFQLLLHAWSRRAFQTTRTYFTTELKIFKV